MKFHWNKAKETDLAHLKNHAESLEHEKKQFESERRKPLKELVKSLKEFNANQGSSFSHIGSPQSWMVEHDFVKILEENAEAFLNVLEPFRKKDER